MRNVTPVVTDKYYYFVVEVMAKENLLNSKRKTVLDE